MEVLLIVLFGGIAVVSGVMNLVAAVQISGLESDLKAAKAGKEAAEGQAAMMTQENARLVSVMQMQTQGWHQPPQRPQPGQNSGQWPQPGQQPAART